MKRFAAMLIALVMMLTMVPAMADEVTGTAKGFGGEVTVTLTLTDGVITDAKAEGAGETPGVGTPALEQLPAAMVAGNTVNVDVFSGATFTSNAVIEAAKAALVAAGLNPDDYMTKAEAVKAEDATYEADVVIVGAGGAGMTAALAAAEQGATVIIVESQAAVGGNSVRATGGMKAGDTETQNTNTFGEQAGVEAVLKNAAGYADNAEITKLAEEVKFQWMAYQQAGTDYFDTVELTPDGWHLHDRSKPTAQVYVELYRTIQAAAGPDTLVMGCNTYNHLCAGIHQIQRSGYDTSSNWNITRRRGINCLAFRQPQNRRFFLTDADCAPFTEHSSYQLNLDFLDCVARSGSSMFASIKPGVLTDRQLDRIREVFAVGSRHGNTSEAVDWMQHSTPSQYLFDGQIYTYDWYSLTDGAVIL